MFDIGWTELMVIGIVALIVVGPKDLPKMFRTLGQMTAKARGMAREFQRAMDDAADASGVKDVARDLRKATDPQGMGLDELNKMRKWDPLKDDPKDSGTVAEDDEAAFDQIATEMDSLRGRKSPVTGAAKPGAATPAGASEEKASPPRPPAPPKMPPTAAAPKTAEATSSEPHDKGQA